MRLLLAVLLIAVPCIAHAQQSSWQGEWGTFTDVQEQIGRRISIHDCTAMTCSFSIESGSGTGRESTAEDATFTLRSPTQASVQLYGGDGAPTCDLQLTLQDGTRPAIVIEATGSSCLRYYGIGHDVTMSGTYPLRSRANYIGTHRDECFSDRSPATLAICMHLELSDLEQSWKDLSDEYPLAPLQKDDQQLYAKIEARDATYIKTCDTASNPEACLQQHYSSDVAAMQAMKGVYMDGTTERGDPAVGHALALKIAGTYIHRFKDGDVEGDTYTAVDKLTIRPVGAASIHFDTDLNFFNGHTCSLDGGALYRKDGTFVFDDEAKNALEGEPVCRLAIKVTDKGVEFQDITGGCKLYCGARGGWNGEGFTFKQRVTKGDSKPTTAVPKASTSKQ